MAKNFTDFHLVSGSKTPSTDSNGAPTGLYDVTTQADRENFVVGYAADEPGGERKYSLESIIHLTDQNDIGLEHVDNLSRAMILDDSVLTGDSTAVNLRVTGNFITTGAAATLETSVTTTSAMEIDNDGTSTTLRAIQRLQSHDIANFIDNENVVMVVNADGVGIGSRPMTDPDVMLNVVGGTIVTKSLSATDNVMGRDINSDGNKLDTIAMNADKTALNLTNVSGQRNDNMSGFDLIENDPSKDVYTKVPSLSATGNDLNTTVAIWKSEKGEQFLQQHPHAGDNLNTLDIVTPGNPGYMLFDASYQKLQSVEGEADQTSAHSADLTYNDIPDGPNTFNSQTTFVKMLSSEREYIDSIVTVDEAVVDTTRGGYNNKLVALDIVETYQNSYPDYWSTTDEQEYRDTIVPSASAAVQNKRNTATGEAYTQSELVTYFDLQDNNTDGFALLERADITELQVADLTIGTGMSTVTGQNVKPGIDAVVNFGDEELHFVNGILVAASDEDVQD